MKKILKVAAILAVLVFAGVFIYLQNTQGTVNVVVAAKQINAGTRITRDMVQVQSLPVKAVPQGVEKDINHIIGKTVKVARVKGDLIPLDIVTNINVVLHPGEELANIPLTDADAKLLNAGDLITIIPVSNSTTAQAQAVSGIEVVTVSQNTSSTGQSTSTALIRTTGEAFKVLAPYIKSGNFVIAVDQQK